MNILLVDDDNMILSELTNNIDWKKLGLQKVFVANSMSDAQKVLCTVPVQIMLCDIEMPGGSGLKLLEWIRSQKHEVQCIFLTNYADFSYAKQAIQLESLEYLLKPVEPEKVSTAVSTAIQRATRSMEDAQARRNSAYWMDSQKEAKELFWHRSLLQDAAVRAENLTRLGYDGEDKFILGALKTASISKVENQWGADMFEYALKNVLFELLETIYFTAESVFSTPDRIWIIVCRFLPGVAPDSGALEEYMQLVVDACEKSLQIKVITGVGYVCKQPELRNQLKSIHTMLENTLDDGVTLFSLQNYNPQVHTYTTPDISSWESLLKAEQSDSLLCSIRRYLQKKTSDGLTRDDIVAFRQDVTQMIYAYLRSANIQAHKLFAERQGELLYQRSCNSVQDMCLYCELLIDKAIEYKRFTEQPQSIIESIRRYVDVHYCEDINRSDLVNLVYISPDYCSRLFRKETGQSLAQYILEKRMKKARELLLSSMPVKSVALQVGYSNFSYFSKVFRDMNGMAPIEYREQIFKQQ